MDPGWVVGGLFVGAFALLAFLNRHKDASLDKLPSAPEERVIFDDGTARFGALPYHHALYTSIYVARGLVRVTNRRVIAAQPYLFSSRYCVRYVIYYGPHGMPPGADDPFRQFYTSFSVQPDGITLENGTLRIKPSSSATHLPIYLDITMARATEVLNLVQRPA